MGPAGIGCSSSGNITNLLGPTSTDGPSVVTVVAPSAFSYSVATVSANRGQSISPLTPSVTGTSLVFSASPSLPAGLSLDRTTGVISGAPTVFQLATSYTITASNSVGSVQTTLSISSSGYFSVNALTDTNDSSAGDGICSDGSSACSLRSAIQESNAVYSASSVPSLIDVAASGTVTLSLGALSITGKLQLNGHGLTINGNAASRVMSITGSDVSLSNLVVTNGAVAGDGAGILHSTSSGTLSLDNVTLSSNVAGTAGFNGGGISSNGLYLKISNSVISSNTNGQNNAGYGGGIAYSGERLEVISTQVTGNYGGRRGGGIYLTGGSAAATALIRGSHIATNNGGTHSGGLENFGSHTVTIDSSSFYNNTGATADIANFGPIILIQSSTLVGTNAGGAVLQDSTGGGFDLRDSTVSTNGTPVSMMFSPLNLLRTILISTTGGAACSLSMVTLTSNGYNLTNGSSCGLSGTGDLQKQTPANVLNSFVPVQSGITYYLPLKIGSAAIDAAGTGCGSLDQLGLPRPVNKGGGLLCDIGASEVQ